MPYVLKNVTLLYQSPGTQNGALQAKKKKGRKEKKERMRERETERERERKAKQ